MAVIILRGLYASLDYFKSTRSKCGDLGETSGAPLNYGAGVGRITDSGLADEKSYRR